MIPKYVYDKLAAEGQKLWHSHELEVKSGLLILPKPAAAQPGEWENAELAAMKEIVGLYSKTWRTWQVDRGDEVPLGKLMSVLQPEMQLTLRKVSSVLMGSATDASQIDLDVAVEGRNKQYGVQYAEKAKPRAEMKLRGFTRTQTRDGSAR